jgi:hypothetical protein
MARARKPRTPFYRFNSSPEVIRLVALIYVRFPLSLRNALADRHSSMAEPRHRAEVIARTKSFLDSVQNATQCVASGDTVLDLGEG